MDRFDAVAILDDPVRRALYEFVRRAHRAMTREEAAHSQRISVKLAAFHLDKLVSAGLLTTHAFPSKDLPRKVGRAPKRYEISNLEVSLSIPPRRYDLLGEVLLDALIECESQESQTDAALRAARQKGGDYASRAQLNLGRPGPERTIAACEGLLDELGYDPADDGAGGLVLLNCPFHRLVGRAPELVCAINEAFIDGMLRGLGNESVQAALEPGVDRCCVCVHR